MKRFVLPRLLPIVIAIASTACSLRRPIAVADAPPRSAALTSESLRILEQIERGEYLQADCEIDKLSDAKNRDPAALAVQDLLNAWLEERCHESTQASTTQAPRTPPQPPAVPDEAFMGPLAPADPGPSAMAAEPESPPDLPTVPAPAAVRRLDAAEIEALKSRGMQLYREGKVAAALKHWKTILADSPGDEEVIRLAARAEKVLDIQGAQ